MARNSIWLKAFSRDADFVVGGKSFLLNGEEQRPGESFDKSKVHTRLLRSLYEQRKIFVAPPKANDDPVIPEVPPVEPQVQDPNTEPSQDAQPVTGTGAIPAESGGQPGEEPAASNAEVPAVDEDPVDDDDADAPAADETKAYVKHIGRGTYGVFIGTDRMAGPMSKEEAQAEADKLNG